MTEKRIPTIASIAAQNDMSCEEVKHMIMETINAGGATADPYVQAMWKKAFPDGQEPDLELFLKYTIERARTIAGMLREKESGKQSDS